MMLNRAALGLLLVAALAAGITGCARTATPEERAVEAPREAAPPASADEIGLDEDVEIPAIDVDTRARVPER